MSLIVEHETKTYEQAWAIPAYNDHSPGEVRLPVFLDMIGAISAASVSRLSVLDAGCGAGKGALALQGVGFREIHLCDYTDAGLLEEARAFRFTAVTLWDDLRLRLGYLRGRAVDYVYCCDVLEHIPPEFTMLVIQRLLDVSRLGVFLSISLLPDAFGAFVGRPLHMTVMPYQWWRDHLAELAEVVEGRDLLSNAAFLIRRRDA